MHPGEVARHSIGWKSSPLHWSVAGRLGRDGGTALGEEWLKADVDPGWSRSTY
jgi:hypothetical protein